MSPFRASNSCKGSALERMLSDLHRLVTLRVNFSASGRTAIFHAAALCLFCAYGAGTVDGQLPTSVIQSMSQQAVQIGSTVRIKMNGDRCEELSGLTIYGLKDQTGHVDGSPILSPLQPLRDWQDGTGEFDIAIPAGSSPGLAEIRCNGLIGMTNSRRLLLTTLPVDLPNTDNTSRDNAYSLTSGRIVNQSMEQLKPRFYRLSLRHGQRLRVALYSKPLDSVASELRLRLLDRDGRTLVSSRSIGDWPAELTWDHPSQEPSDYFMELTDLLSQGGPEFNFVMETRVDQLEGGVNASLVPLELNQLLRPRLSESANSDQAAGMEVVDATELTEVAFKEIPSRIRGNLRRPLRVDFHAEQGQVLDFDVASAKLGQLTDPALVLYKLPIGEGGAVTSPVLIGNQDDGPYLGNAAVRVRAVDPNWTWTVPETAAYQLLVIDNQSGVRPDDSLRFWLNIHVAQPSFTMLAYHAFPTNDPAASRPRGNCLMKSGTESIHVTLHREDGFAGAVELHIEGLPDGCRCEPVIVPPGATQARLVIQASESIADSVAAISVVGLSHVGEQSIRATATPFEIYAPASPTFNAVRSRPTGVLELAVASGEVAPLQVQLGESKVVEVKLGQKATVPVTLLRTVGSAGECTLRPQDVPSKVAIPEIKIAGDQSQANVEITVAADAAPGEYTFWMLAESKVKWRVHPQSLEREQAYLEKLKSALMPPEAAASGVSPREFSREQIETAIATTNARVEQLTARTAEQEIVMWVPSNTLRVQVQQ